MTELIDELEECRLGAGLSQKAVAADLGISQPHYSKVVGGVVTLTDELAGLIGDWVKGRPAAARQNDERRDQIRKLSRSIGHDLRRLNELLAAEGRGPGRRSPRPTRDRRRS